MRIFNSNADFQRQCQDAALGDLSLCDRGWSRHDRHMNEDDKKSLRRASITEVIGLQGAIWKKCLRSFRGGIRKRGHTMSFSIFQSAEFIRFFREKTVHQTRSRWRGYVY